MFVKIILKGLQTKTWKAQLTEPSSSTKQIVFALSILLTWIIYAALRTASRKRPILPDALSPRPPADEHDKYNLSRTCYGIANFNRAPMVMVPNDKISWFIDRKDNATDHEPLLMDIIVAEHSFPDAEACRPVQAMRTTLKHITPRLPKLIFTMQEEVEYQFDRHWAMNNLDYTEVLLVESLTHIMDAVVCRSLLDQSICRDEAFTRHLFAFNRGVERNIALWPMVPDMLRPLIGPLCFKAPQWWLYSSLRPFFTKAVKQRLQAFAGDDAGQPVPDDFISWYIMDAKLVNRTDEPTPDEIAAHFVALNFGAIVGPRMACANAVLDILSCDPKDRVLDILHDEITTVYRSAGCQWTKSALDKLHHLESAIHESLRLSPFEDHGPCRVVMAKEGLHHEEEGWTAEQGTVIATDVWKHHHDPELYPEPHCYDPFRYSRKREQLLNSTPSAERDASLKSLNLTYVGNDFLAFGTGRHTCPGRFYAEQVVKLTLAHIITNYDLEPRSKRPAPFRLGRFAVPSPSARIRVRRNRTAGLMGNEKGQEA